MRRGALTSHCAFAIAAFVLVTATVDGEELQIDLANAMREPLLETFLPPAGSPDRVRVTNEGMWIQQAPDVVPSKTGAAGLKMLLPLSGDFSVALDCRCLRLTEPRKGWGQGLVLSVFLDDNEQTVLKLARLACPTQGPLCRATSMQLRSTQQPMFWDSKVDFDEGSLTVTRTGHDVTFTVDNGKERHEVAACQCPTADVRVVEVVCTRLPIGNTEAEYLLQHLRIDADRFFSYQPPRVRWFTWWRIMICSQVAVLVGLLIALARRRAQ